MIYIDGFLAPVAAGTTAEAYAAFADKATRDAGMAKVMQDPRMQHGTMEMPFDGARMVFGGFRALVDR